MKKARKSSASPDDTGHYNFRMGVRGKYADHGTASVSKAERGVDIRVWAPLVDFHWSGVERQITDDTWIRPASAYHGYKSGEFANFISKDERDTCRNATHWLSLVQPAHHDLSTRANVNSVLLALWIVVPTATSVALRFDEAESGVRTVARALDRFQWVKGQAVDEVEDEHLDLVASLLSPVRATYAKGRRLRNALGLTFRACVSVDWQVAFICFTSAAEALLTCSRGPDNVDDLAMAYGRLVNASGASERAEIDRFKRLYSTRSDVIHGYAFDRGESGRNLTELGDMSDLLRRMWRIVLESEELRTVLEQDDERRRLLFLGR